MDTPMKQCNVCGANKPIMAFAKDKRRKDGYTCRCKSCDTIKHRKYRPPVHGRVQSRSKSASDHVRWNMVVKYGIDVVEAMESMEYIDGV